MPGSANHPSPPPSPFQRQRVVWGGEAKPFAKPFAKAGGGTGAGSPPPSLSDLALALAARGLPVFPCNVSKQPIVEGGFKSATKEPAVIREIFARQGAALIGVPTGRTSSLVVIDVDPRHGGDAWLEENKGRLPRTRTHTTPSGGLHLFFRDPPVEIRNSQGRIAPGVDVRGTGGYVIFPPSQGYTVKHDGPLAEAPAWLISACLPPPSPPPPPPQPRRAALAEDGTAYGLAALSEECRAIQRADFGQQESTLNKAALKIGSLVAGGELLERYALTELLAAGKAMPNESGGEPWRADEIEKKVRRAFEAGQRHPRRASPGPAEPQQHGAGAAAEPPPAGGKSYSHIWRSKDHDYPCTPTGEEWRDENDGRVYAKVRTPEGTQHLVPEDELVPARGGNGPVGDGASEPSPTDDDAELTRLARLAAIEYERARAEGAKRLGCRAAMLDRIVAAKRVELRLVGSDGLPGRPLKFDEIEPWPEAVDGAAMLSELSDAIGTYVIMAKHQRDASALWAVFAHAHDLRDFAPLLIVKSAVMRSGKSRFAEIMERLTPRPLLIAGLTAAFIERAIEDNRCTLIVDEADRIRKGNPALAECIDAQFNRSFKRRGSRVGKNVPLPGGGYVPRLFSTWAPTFISGIGDQADTAEDRAVIIVLKRKLPTEKIKSLRDSEGEDLRLLARKIVRWVADNEDRLRQHDPAPLDVDNDRAKDTWEPLLAIADVAGGEWAEKRARQAGIALVGAKDEAEANLKLMLLGDLRNIFAATFPRGTDATRPKEGPGRPDEGPRLASAEIIKRLIALEDRPYGALGKHQKPLDQNGLARLLKDFEIRSTTVRLDGGARAKGYYRSAFEDAFARYLPPLEKASQGAQTPISPLF